MDLLRIAAHIASISSTVPDMSGTHEEMFERLTNEFELLGKGSARAVFSLSKGRVLKVALPGAVAKGIAQNREEASLSEKLQPMVTRVFSSDPKFLWIEAELASSLQIGDLEKAVGESDLTTLVDIAELSDKRDWARKEYGALEEGPKKEFIDGVKKLLDAGLYPGDLERQHQWGKTSDGRIVCLDYGLSSKNYDDIYV